MLYEVENQKRLSNKRLILLKLLNSYFQNNLAKQTLNSIWIKILKFCPKNDFEVVEISFDFEALTNFAASFSFLN